MSIKKYQRTEEVDRDRYTVLIEDGKRLLWHKIAVRKVKIPRNLNWVQQHNPRQVSNSIQQAISRAFQVLDLTRRLPQLPNELIDQILVHAAAFNHQAVMTTTPFHNQTNTPVSRTRLGVYKRQNWSDIPMFQLSRSFRKEAIRIYGEPSKDCFPFNSAVDTLTVNVDEEGTFLTGDPAKSSIISEHVREITIRLLNGRSFTLNRTTLQAFGKGAAKTQAIIDHLCQQWVQALKTTGQDWVFSGGDELYRSADLVNFLANNPTHHPFDRYMEPITWNDVEHEFMPSTQG